MATNVPIPFIGMDVDLSDPKDIAMTAALGVVGFMMFFGFQDLGSNLWNSASQALGVGQNGDAPEVL